MSSKERFMCMISLARWIAAILYCKDWWRGRGGREWGEGRGGGRAGKGIGDLQKNSAVFTKGCQVKGLHICTLQYRILVYCYNPFARGYTSV